MRPALAVPLVVAAVFLAGLACGGRKGRPNLPPPEYEEAPVPSASAAPAPPASAR